MTESTSKAELMAQINQAWTAYTDAVAGADQSKLTVPGADGWSIKDQIAHVSAWERYLIAILTGQSRAAAIAMDEAGYAAADVDEMNAHIVARAADLPVAEVQAQALATHDELLAVLDRLSWDDLNKPYTHYQPGSQPESDRPVLQWVIGNTTEHYPEHQEYLERTRAGLG